MIKTLDIKSALITGGGGGIGFSIAQYFSSLNKKVIICGRTESKLQEAQKQLKGSSYYVLDTGDIKAIPDFIKKITTEHPDLDCLVNNAGVQRPLSVNDMEPRDFLEKADNEININVHGPMHLAVGLLPHFKTKPGAVIMNVSSVLGFIPTSILNPVYNGTKSFVHFWSMNLRTQLEQGGHNIRVIEIAPPSVSTDLHRERADPNDNKKDKNASALTVEEFMDEIIEQWKADVDVMGAGPSKQVVDKWYESFGEKYDQAAGKK
ncbi:hypothetical protein LTR78_008057 [Recurvomyces mirabilis]|uniref:Short-chain dehydrogenase n=1 Tax=Recurvomyces mirabilis TaxID=574656 RepID=A0AAE0TRQ5_9PEZI|nr:hypothetical protein LTR78_008057 [Recurvomyces mirabilis]KAK5150785.1 hypothetical protein LTS14_009848 [Recurvomyces mirabilis]